jgi:hypothetical protein
VATTNKLWDLNAKDLSRRHLLVKELNDPQFWWQDVGDEHHANMRAGEVCADPPPEVVWIDSRQCVAKAVVPGGAVSGSRRIEGRSKFGHRPEAHCVGGVVKHLPHDFTADPSV